MILAPYSFSRRITRAIHSANSNQTASPIESAGERQPSFQMPTTPQKSPATRTAIHSLDDLLILNGMVKRSV